jgi:glycosyltransferase involved in cell wall biosynthesis
MGSKVIGINLLSFDSASLTGVGYFFKRLMEALPLVVDLQFVIFCQTHFPLEQVIQIPEGINWRRVNVPAFRSRVHRILYEQTILPFLCKSVDVLFSPCVANPLLSIGYRTVSTIHDLTPFFVPSKYGFAQHLYVKAITRLLASSSSLVITVSENSKSDLMRVLHVDGSKIEVLYNFVPERSASAVSYENYFLAVGTRQPAKNLSGVIKAFALFSKKYDRNNHQLKIVGGSGWGDDEYSSLVAALGMQERIQFTGYIPEAELDELYRGCKGLIILSFYEGFGIPVLEALSWSKPAVASNVSSLPEVAGPTGILVDPFDGEAAALAIQSIAEDPQSYLTGRDGQLAKFSPGVQIEKFLSILSAQANRPSTWLPRIVSGQKKSDPQSSPR